MLALPSHRGSHWRKKERDMVQQISGNGNNVAMLQAAGGHHHHGAGKAEMQGAAQALNMSDTDLAQALQNGTSIADLAKQKGVSLDTVKAAMLKPAQTRLDKDLASGKIDQATHDRMLQRIQDNITNLVQGSGQAQGTASTSA
jgi:hypothetical protein